jgi:glyoxylase-like metal-dependent hydrolase (beta-lactamase superfamily II)
MGRAPAIELVPGVWRIPTVVDDGINSFVFMDADGQVTLLDAALPFRWKAIVHALSFLGIGPSDVTRILVTHAHGDHAGGVARMVALTGAPVSIHADDAPYMRSGHAPPIDPRIRFGRLIQRWVSFPPAEVAEELEDDQLLGVGGGLRVLHTPGHTPGHMSLLHEPSGLLITGDAMYNFHGRLGVPPKWFTHDNDLTEKSVHRLGEAEYNLVAFTHGPEIRDNAREAVRSFLASRPVSA